MKVFKNHVRVYRNCIKVFDIVYKFKRTRYKFFILIYPLLTTKNCLKKGI